MASSFYAEFGEPIFWASTPATVHLIIKCRIPPGPALNDLAMKLYSKRSQIHVRVDSDPPSSALACPRSVWAAVKKGKPFLRQVRARIGSSRSRLEIETDLLHGTGRAAISNSPCDLAVLARISTGIRENSHAQRLNASLSLLKTELADMNI
jgi:hypothetical protein